MQKFTWERFLIRWGLALALVFATFNPFGYSFYHWAVAEGGSVPLKILVGVSILIAFVIFVRATLRSIGPVGIGLATAFFVAAIWLLVDLGLLGLEQSKVLTTVLLFVIASILAIGVSWSHIRRRISGQADIDDVDD